MDALGLHAPGLACCAFCHDRPELLARLIVWANGMPEKVLVCCVVGSYIILSGSRRVEYDPDMDESEDVRTQVVFEATQLGYA
jgi:hypothetical protein